MKSGISLADVDGRPEEISSKKEGGDLEGLFYHLEREALASGVAFSEDDTVRGATDAGDWSHLLVSNFANERLGQDGKGIVGGRAQPAGLRRA